MENNRNIKKYYYLSLLGIIPGFGILIGTYLLIYSSIKFKNLKLGAVIICNIVIGIVVMRLDNYYLKQEMKYGVNSNNGFKYFAQIYLDSIQSKLEMFKEYSGAYPDSLQELKRIFPELQIEDPLLSVDDRGTKKIYFYYEKKGEKYILFSSGIDRIPNTEDDIFPREFLKRPGK